MTQHDLTGDYDPPLPTPEPDEEPSEPWATDEPADTEGGDDA